MAKIKNVLIRKTAITWTKHPTKRY